MMLRSPAPISENWSVRGIGVAVSVRQSTVVRSVLIFSLWATPNFCSSSTTSKPRSLNFLPSPAGHGMISDDDINLPSSSF